MRAKEKESQMLESIVASDGGADGDLSATIPMGAIVAGVGAMTAFVDDNGNLQNECIAEAFSAGLRAALFVIKLH
ncbi:MAG: hypothetical protein AB7H90_21475 [Alphaproteobacteria bacterium]